MPDEKCPHRKCLKEINPQSFPGIYFGTPFVYDENSMACYLCQREPTQSPKLIKRVIPIDTEDWDQGYKELFKLLTRRQK